jgi:tetratricopeptide (TPR) repeat protein
MPAVITTNKAIDFGGCDGLHGLPPCWRTDLMSESTTSTPLTGTSIDELTQAQPVAEQFIDKHQVKLIALVVLLIVAALVFVVQREMKKSQEETAGALLVGSSDVADLKDIDKNYAGTAAAGSSKILLAEQQWEEGEEEVAIATLRGLIDSAEAHPARASALASLAAKVLKQGKTSDAEKLFGELAEDPEAQYLAAYAWIALGDIAAEKGDLDAAEKAYGLVEKDFSGTFYSQDAITRRLLMKAEKPVEVAAPVKLPSAKIIDGEGAASDEAQIKNLLDALKAAGDGSLPPSLLDKNATDE